ncbi:MAG: molybdenum ABC transporter ATP-binding protein [Magnetococcales bacterium]|nr:molybdenum ABC transporter ATP-binding protein [Magnetococcales bacterium]
MTDPFPGLQLSARLSRPDFTLAIDLELPGRGVMALFGPSGSGKTTLLRIVAGLERPTRGHLHVNGELWQESDKGFFLPPHRRSVGYVFQDAALFSHLDVRGNLTYGLRRVPAGGGQVVLDQVVALLGIEPLLSRRPDTLSGGERQRVAIARALAVTPALLLLDEPLAALDLARKREILPYLERLHNELKIPVLYVSHASDEVARLADHLVVMDAGSVVASGSIHEILARVDPPIRLGEESGVVLDAVIGARDDPWHLSRADFVGGSLWMRDHGLPVGRQVRVRILARDVSLALEHHPGTSIQNILPGQVVAVAPDTHPAQVLVRVQVGASPLLARITRRAVANLELVPGKPIWVQVKSVALIE